MSMHSPPHPSISPVPESPTTAPVRRHHTISTSTRTARTASRISEEGQEWTVEDEYVGPEDWVGGVGAVGEKQDLHRHSSLPAKYNRPFRSTGQSNLVTHSGSVTPSSRSVNSLSAITAEHGAEEEEWEREMRGWNSNEEIDPDGHGHTDDGHGQPSTTPLSPHFAPPLPSPPLATAAGVRRHQSLTYGAATGATQPAHTRLSRTATTGKRVGGRSGRSALSAHPGFTDASPSPPETADGVEEEDWNSTQGNEDVVDDLQRALSYLEVSESQLQQQQQQQQQPQPRPSQLHIPSQDQHIQQSRLTPPMNQPPRFGATSPALSSATPTPTQGNHMSPYPQRSPHKLQLVTDLSSNAQYQQQKQPGPVSASAYVPPIGHGGLNMSGPGPQPPIYRTASGFANPINGNGVAQHILSQFGGPRESKPLTATGTTWDQKDRIMGMRDIPPVPPMGNYSPYLQAYGGAFMDPSVGLGMQFAAGLGMGSQQQQQLQHSQLQQQQQHNRLNVNVTPSILAAGGAAAQALGMGNDNGMGQNNQNAPGSNMLASPVDVPSLIAAKGYNPANFDIRPAYARFFVIKSYTEDDVHKSLKYEIWSSTDPGNKRLDKAFKECAGRGPIYLFFSVNASGHFCGMAEMLTPVDYTRSSTVWAQDKWKGVFKVRWIFVRDVPNLTLRHIRLNNTQERKPVTNSRDTQELLPEAGQEMLRIFYTHPARTSLLQDFAFYELQSMQKLSSPSPPQQPQQHPYAMPNPATMLPQQQQQMQNQFGYSMQQIPQGAMAPRQTPQSYGVPGNMGGMGQQLGFQSQ